jgi:hypothetical protein
MQAGLTIVEIVLLLVALVATAVISDRLLDRHHSRR